MILAEEGGEGLKFNKAVNNKREENFRKSNQFRIQHFLLRGFIPSDERFIHVIQEQGLRVTTKETRQNKMIISLNNVFSFFSHVYALRRILIDLCWQVRQD